jgi:hypothetical protein
MSTMTVRSSVEQHEWQPQPAAQGLVNGLVSEFLARCPSAAELARRMRVETGTRFVDWVDHIQAPATASLEEELLEVGFERHPFPGAPECYVHNGGIFPQVVLGSGPVLAVAIKVDSVADFVATHPRGESGAIEIEGEPLAPMRRAREFVGDRAEMWVIERHGYRAYSVPAPDAAKGIKTLKHLEAFRGRRRDFLDAAEGFAHVNRLVDAAIADLGRDLTCDLFFEAERRYWQSRNRAAQVQKGRQDRLGLGWANHDHHTYRCSRHVFKDLVALWEKLGFRCRERFYAGAEAGWGAQVMEQPVTGITTFNDVDMSPEELLGDFSHEGLPAGQGTLGTVGLWCGLHGEAVFQAGMHHLECQFDWHALVDQLESTAHINTMAPFTTFPYLRQAFTEGERWAVDPARVRALLSHGHITPEQAEQFRVHGAIGSHLENLERNDGFKGFNQKGVSDIIAKTDPRKLVAAGA